MSVPDPSEIPVLPGWTLSVPPRVLVKVFKEYKIRFLLALEERGDLVVNTELYLVYNKVCAKENCNGLANPDYKFNGIILDVGDYMPRYCSLEHAGYDICPTCKLAKNAIFGRRISSNE